MGRVIHFEIQASDIARAMKFYEETMGWSFKKWDGPAEYYLIVTGPPEEMGINGGLLKRMGPDPLQGQGVNCYVCTCYVKSLDESVKLIESKGGKVVVQKMPVQGVGWLAYCTDTEGNIFGIMQGDKEAK